MIVWHVQADNSLVLIVGNRSAPELTIVQSAVQVIGRKIGTNQRDNVSNARKVGGKIRAQKINAKHALLDIIKIKKQLPFAFHVCQALSTQT
jgi:hypothetical protein